MFFYWIIQFKKKSYISCVKQRNAKSFILLWLNDVWMFMSARMDEQFIGFYNIQAQGSKYGITVTGNMV